MAGSPERLASALADRYRIERELGAGGMATVYLAEDLKHQRNVAVKVLRPELAAVLGAERFVQEITTTASLQHPHILPLFDSGEADGFLYYVMPYIDGETLRDRLNRDRQLGIEDAVRITTEVADALDYAHRHGVIHRDIKPENILLHDGRAMVADFGIALAVSAAAGGRMTETGLSLGTPHYMSPEQATAEREITSRSDIYSLACVLYEMLTGDPPHTGSVVQQIIMKIVTEEAAPVTSVRKSVPAHVAAAIATAIEKLPADRFESARQFADALANPAFATSRAPGTAAPALHRGEWQMRWAPRLAAIAALAVGLAIWGWLRPRPEVSPRVSRYSFTLPDSQALGVGIMPRIVLLPDGRGLVYSVFRNPGDPLMLRRMNALHATPIPGTENAFMPFVAPDGERIGFMQLAPFRLRVTSVAGGSARTLPVTEYEPQGMDWGPDGHVYLGTWQGLIRVPDSGGAVEQLTEVLIEEGETGHVNPDVLPDGDATVFTVLRGPELERASIAVADLASGNHRVLFPGTDAMYAETGHLVYVDAARNLMAVAFDPSTRRTAGDPVQIASGIRSVGQWGAEFSISPAGDLVYVTGEPNPFPDDMVWVTREGVETVVDPAWMADFSALDLSPDGRRLAITIRDAAGRHIWLKEMDDGPIRKVTYDGTANGAPVWHPDGRSISFVSSSALVSTVQAVPVDGSAPPALVFESERTIMDMQWTPDREWLVYGVGGDQGPDILAIRPGTDSVPVEVAADPRAAESVPQLSPDGRWLAYVSTETGRPEVYVRPFPTDGPRAQVSSGGGEEPRWANSGRELFYRNSNNRMTVVAVQLGATFGYGAPDELFDWGFLDNDRWVPSPDDRRFLFVRTPLAPTSELIMVENFFQELRERVRP